MDTEIKGLYQIIGPNGTILLGYTNNGGVIFMLVFDAQHLAAAMEFMREIVKILANLSMHNPKSIRRNVVDVDDIHGVCGRSVVELTQDDENVRIRLIRGFSREYDVTFEQLMFLLNNSMCCLQPVRLNSAFMACNECEMCTAQ
jgi:hypothetical protein